MWGVVENLLICALQRKESLLPVIDNCTSEITPAQRFLVALIVRITNDNSATEISCCTDSNSEDN